MDLGYIFGDRRGEKSRKNCVEKHAFFGYRFFSVFLRFLAILLGFWEAPGPQKIEKNRKKSEKIDFLTRSVLKEGSGRVLGGFWEGSGRIFDGFWMDFGRFWADFLQLFKRIWKGKRWAFYIEELMSMIRATRGRSMDGWMDKWMEKT